MPDEKKPASGDLDPDIVEIFSNPPDTYASLSQVMDDLEDLWNALEKDSETGSFDTEIHSYVDHADGFDSQDIELDYAQYHSFPLDDLSSWPLIEKPILIAYNYCYSAWVQKHLMNSCGAEWPAWIHKNAQSFAWESISRALYWKGVCETLLRHSKDARAKNAVSHFASKGGKAANKENNELRQQAFDWLDVNFETICTSMDDAAEKLTKIIPMKFRTCRTYVASWKKSIS